MRKCTDKTLGELNGGWVLAFKVVMAVLTIAVPADLGVQVWQTLQIVELRERQAVVEATVCDPVERTRRALAIARIEARLSKKGG